MLQCSGVALCKVGHPRLGHLNKAVDGIGVATRIWKRECMYEVVG
jgi:hypothetical protein